MLLADTNILSTFAKIDHLSLLLRLFSSQRVGVVPAVYGEFQKHPRTGFRGAWYNEINSPDR
jgi:hypothetical protein